MSGETQVGFECPEHGVRDSYVPVAGSVLPHCPVPGCGRLVQQVEIGRSDDEPF